MEVESEVIPSLTALETDFPTVYVSKIAEAESWRKELHRPATHTHKWWALRLGSVFRSIICAALTTNADTCIKQIESKRDLDDLVIFDPFSGSGTTLVEAIKLGAKAIGHDINPVATLVERQAVAKWDLNALLEAFRKVEDACKREILSFYKTEKEEPVLYYFWVATANCPKCNEEVELFSNRIFSKNAYPNKKPAAKAKCAHCTELADVRFDSEIFECSNGHHNTSVGSVNGRFMTCQKGHQSKILDLLDGKVPSYKMYAKLVLNHEGEKQYQPIVKFDLDLYNEAKKKLEFQKDSLIQPAGGLEEGHNTRQAISWGFKRWEDFFHSRQLLALGLLAKAIKDIECDSATREALMALFSGTLEFNNRFCSFKGEGTGAVRHMFSHHTLQPERMPLEANPWGYKNSSGAFSKLFESRLLRALEYKKHPTDFAIKDGDVEKISGISHPLSRNVHNNWNDFKKGNDAVYIKCADSGMVDLPDEVVDMVITDPPYMDNVHYSELADFFHAWLKKIEPFSDYPTSQKTTRSVGEVQSATPEGFSDSIERVWKECARVLKHNGIVAFTFHHSKIEGWIALTEALTKAGLTVTSLQPVKAEMSTSITKSAAKHPNNLDSIVVCRKKENVALMPNCISNAEKQLRELKKAGIPFSQNDVFSIIRGAVFSKKTYNHSLSIEDLSKEAEIKSLEVASHLL